MTRLSFTKLSRYETCPLSYKLHYLDRLKSEPGVPLLFGSAVHAVLEGLVLEHMREERVGALSEDRAAELWQEAWTKSGMSGLDVFREGLDLVHRFVREQGILDHHDVLAVEKEFRLTIGGFQVIGYLDRVDRRAGVVYDVLGINGHRASALLAWNEALLAEQLAARAPDLVVLSYGGNEALDPNLALSTYEEQTDAAIARVRRLAPGASCLLVGPLATYEEHASRMSAVTTIQRRLAAAHGCAFWDSAATSGGPGTLGRWGRFPGMVGHDRLHLGRLGYEEVGRGFVSALLRGAGLM